MYFRELSQLLEANPDQAETLVKLDKYLDTLRGLSKRHLVATDVAQHLGAPRHKVLGLLMAAARLGLLKLKFRVSCPLRGHGIRDFDDLSQIPQELHCDICDEPHQITPDDIEFFFELVDRAVPVDR